MDHDDMTEHVQDSSAARRSLLSRVSAYAANALQYWEPRRFVYNGALALVVVGHFVAALPASRERVSLDYMLAMFLLAVLANVAYCAVYPIDLFMQFSGLDSAWRRGRVVVLAIGTAFAATITHFIVQAQGNF